MTSSPPLAVTDLTLIDITRLIGSGQTTPTELAKAYLARIDALEERVRAWSHLDRDDVLRQAAILTEEARTGRLRGPLHGVPVAVKDEFHVKGMPTYFATPDGRPQPEDATPVARLRQAGAIIMGKTTMPIGGEMPPTRNPWNLAHTAGASSSGSGAVVGARMVPIALGEQTAGSNLRPAAYCGVEGLKPTFGRISRFGCYQFSYSHDHVGLIGLTMEDIALLYSVIGGPDPRDHTTLPDPPPAADLQISTIQPPRIGVVRNFFPERTDEVQQGAVESAAARMKEAGAQVVDVMLPDDFEMLWTVHRIVGGSESLTFKSRQFAETDAPVTPRDLANSLIPASYYLQAQRLRNYFWMRLQKLYTDLDVLLMSVAPTPPPLGEDGGGEPLLLIPWSCVGYPAITVNAGITSNNLPLGVQLVAPPMADYELMRVGVWCENTLGRLPAPPIS